MSHKGNNPFTLTFGKYPERYISRYENTDMICSAFSSSSPLSQIYMIEGIRGSGKTVLMTAVTKQLCSSGDWIVVDLNSTRNLLDDLAHRLYDTCNNIPKLLDKGFNVSLMGVSVGMGGVTDYRDSVSVISDLLGTAGRKGRRVLITIDEVMHNQDMREFAAQFQIWLRQDQPVYLLMTGLYDNIYSIQNDPALTFLLRSPKIRLESLSLNQIIRQYKEIFDIDENTALRLAELTKGYAFGFQALGMLCWEYGVDNCEIVLEKYDEMLEDFAYRKIWDSLTQNERRIIRCMGEDDVKVEKIRQALDMSAGTFSKYREKMLKSGVITSTGHGYVSPALPRFHEVTRLYHV